MSRLDFFKERLTPRNVSVRFGIYVAIVLSVLVLTFDARMSAAQGLTEAPAPVIFAAASLKSALDPIADAYAQQDKIMPVISYASSSGLARQIERGAPADLFFSANTRWMDVLQKGGHLRAETRIDLLGNKLVLIAANTRPDALDRISKEAVLDVIGSDHIAIALVDAVPAGLYGKEALQHFDLWDALSGQLVQTDNVRAALSLVALGAVPFGITYETDALAEPKVRVLARFPSGSHSPIRYPVAEIARSSTASEFLAFLSSQTGRTLFKEAGFSLLPVQ